MTTVAIAVFAHLQQMLQTDRAIYHGNRQYIAEHMPP